MVDDGRGRSSATKGPTSSNRLGRASPGVGEGGSKVFATDICLAWGRQIRENERYRRKAYMDATLAAPDSRGAALLAVSVTTVVIALCTCVLRYWVRSRISRTIGWEDYFVGGAMLLGVIGVSFAIVEGASQDGGDLQSARQFDYLAQPWLGMGSTLSKVSVCLLVRRLVARVRPWRAALAVQVLLLLAVNLAYAVATLLQCRPLEKLWKPDVPGTCWGLGVRQGIGYFQGAFDVFTQLFVTMFPIMIVQDLGIPRNVRWPFYLLSITSVIIAMLCVLRTYNISLIQLNERRMFEVITTILAV
ncbi:putative integral membrane protein [Rosellinia necatrix]|uniref:Putative integral membrane protein n=1 Tax=Rosellinia necatrix TaxID=77044 RepID=A0A1W2TCB5_ROSNE|nr:putative integral membrane protein [Rosellinia necatrix]